MASGDEKQTGDLKSQIQTTLIEQGYEVGKIKTKDGLHQVYVRKDGKRYQVFLNNTMEVVKTKENNWSA